jgi:hypothetical protein
VTGTALNTLIKNRKIITNLSVMTKLLKKGVISYNGQAVLAQFAKL